jgi:hypothetical protein
MFSDHGRVRAALKRRTLWMLPAELECHATLHLQPSCTRPKIRKSSSVSEGLEEGVHVHSGVEDQTDGQGVDP